MNIRLERLKKQIETQLSTCEEINVAEMYEGFPEFSRSEFEQKIREINPPLLLVLDQKGKMTPRAQPFTRIHAGSTPHMAVQVLVMTPDDRLILRHRRGNGKWDISASGHVLVGETPLMAAQRCLLEKLDITVAPNVFIRIFPPEALHNGFIKWGKSSNEKEPWYGKHDGIFRYKGGDQENYEYNALFVVRVGAAETQAVPSSFRPTSKVTEIKRLWREGLTGEIDQNPDVFGSGARQYFQDNAYRSLVIDKIWKSSRVVYAFDYDRTLEKAGWPLRKTMANLLARLIVEKGARIAIMSAKAMGESGRMANASEELRHMGMVTEADEVDQALQKGYGILEFAAQKILRELEILMEVDISDRDTSNWLILFPAKSNAKVGCMGGSFTVFEEKFISKVDVDGLIDILNTSFGNVDYLPDRGKWSVWNNPNSSAPTASFIPDKRYVKLYKKGGGVAKILIRPLGETPERVPYDPRPQFVTELRDKIKYAGQAKLEIDKGGSASVDVTAVGKSYGIYNLLGTDRHSEILYFGDEPSGSDRSVFELKNQCPGLTLFDVSSGYEKETEEILTYLLANQHKNREQTSTSDII